MAFNFAKFNKGTKICRPGVDNSDYKFVGLKEFAGKVIHVDGWFLTDGFKENEKQVVVIGEGVNINMPGRAVTDFAELESDDDAMAAVLNGELVLTDIRLLPATKKGYKDTYTYSFANVENI